MRLCGETMLPSLSLALLMCISYRLYRTIVAFSGAAHPAPYSCLKVGRLEPAGGAADEGRFGVWCTGRDLGIREQSQPVL